VRLRHGVIDLRNHTPAGGFPEAFTHSRRLAHPIDRDRLVTAMAMDLVRFARTAALYAIADLREFAR
jgi:hypothetical protein